MISISRFSPAIAGLRGALLMIVLWLQAASLAGAISIAAVTRDGHLFAAVSLLGLLEALIEVYFWSEVMSGIGL
jgi:hypothetical protein